MTPYPKALFTPNGPIDKQICQILFEFRYYSAHRIDFHNELCIWIRKTCENVKDLFDMGEGPHSAQVGEDCNAKW